MSLLDSVAKSYRKNFIESSDKFTFQYVLKILDGWDYNIDAAQTAHSKKKIMHRDLRVSVYTFSYFSSCYLQEYGPPYSITY